MIHQESTDVYVRENEIKSCTVIGNIALRYNAEPFQCRPTFSVSCLFAMCLVFVSNV